MYHPMRGRGGRVAIGVTLQTQGVSLLPPGRPHVRKVIFLAAYPYWLARCQFNVTEWCAMLICDIAHQCASTLSRQCADQKHLHKTHAPHTWD